MNVGERMKNDLTQNKNMSSPLNKNKISNINEKGLKELEYHNKFLKNELQEKNMTIIKLKNENFMKKNQKSSTHINFIENQTKT